jgi:hypothetical protein
MSSVRLHNRNRNTLNNVSKRNANRNSIVNVKNKVYRSTNKKSRNLPKSSSFFTENEGYYGSNYRPYRPEQPFPYVAQSMMPASSLRANARTFIPRAYTPVTYTPVTYTPMPYSIVRVKGMRTPSHKRITVKRNNK